MSDLLEYTKWLTDEYVHNVVRVVDVPDSGPQVDLAEARANAEGWHREFVALQNKLGLFQKYTENHQRWADQKRTEALNANDQSGADQYEEVMAWAAEVLKELAK